MKRKIAICFLAMIIAVAFMPSSAFAASKVKMTTYDQVYKTGNTVYCAGAGNTIYKVKVKNGKVKSKKQLRKKDFWCMGDYTYVNAMKKKGNYLYFRLWTEGSISYLARINISTGKDKILMTNSVDYAIKGKKIYASFEDEETGKVSYNVMKLNGKSKKKTKIKPAEKNKKTNARGYSMKYKKKGKYVKTYLKTPKGTYYLGKIKNEY